MKDAEDKKRVEAEEGKKQGENRKKERKKGEKRARSIEQTTREKQQEM
jgi:hypothetical protein